MTSAVVLVFDAGPLSCFARAGRMDALRSICQDVCCAVTEEVLGELRRGIAIDPRLAGALSADWLQHVRLESLQEIAAFAAYTRLLGSSRERDRGEAATLAWAECNAATAIVDDRAAVHAGRARGVPSHGTLWIVIEGLRGGHLREPQATALVGAFLRDGAWLPFERPDEFIPWARQESLLD